MWEMIVDVQIYKQATAKTLIFVLRKCLCLCNKNKHQQNNNAIPVVQQLQELVFRDQCEMSCYKSEAVTGKTIRSCRVTASVYVTVQLCSSAVNHQQQFCWRSNQRGTCLREHIPCNQPANRFTSDNFAHFEEHISRSQFIQFKRHIYLCNKVNERNFIKLCLTVV